MVENNKKQQEFIEKLLKDGGATKQASIPKVLYPQKWKPHDVWPMDRFLNEVGLWFLEVGVKDDYTKICEVAKFLKGGAVDWLLAVRKANPSGIKNLWTWDQMKKEMCEQFVPKYQHILDTCNLAHVTQRAGRDSMR